MNNKSRLYGTRAVPILRCSTKDQEDTSITDQHDSIKVFALRHGMELGDPIEFVGSGSIKKNLNRLVDQVIERKRRGEQIDIVAFFDDPVRIISDISQTGLRTKGLNSRRPIRISMILIRQGCFGRSKPMRPRVKRRVLPRHLRAAPKHRSKAGDAAIRPYPLTVSTSYI